MSGERTFFLSAPGRTVSACFCVIVVSLSLVGAAFGTLLDHGIRVEGERTLRPGMWRMSGVYSVESRIRPGFEQVTGDVADIDVIRLPISLRYGFSSRWEMGADMQIEQDKGMAYGPSRAYEGSGISYLDAVFKYKCLPWTTFVGRVGVLSEDFLYGGGDVLDYGFDILLTLPLNLPIGVPNLMHFNGGFRMKGGEPDIDRNGRPDINGYTDPVHLGFSFVVSPWARWALVSEFFARRSFYDLEEEAEISFGVRHTYTDRTLMVGSVAHGFSRGSPSWAIRIGLQTVFGSLTERQIVKAEGKIRIPKEIPEEAPAPLEISVGRLTAIAESAFQRQDYLAAADAFSELVSRLPSDGRIYFNLGVCYYNMKDYPRAEGDFLKATTLLSGDPEIYLYLGHCQYLQGRTGDARRSWEHVLEMDSSNELARFLLQSSQ